jgi:hypothetical protein
MKKLCIGATLALGLAMVTGCATALYPGGPTPAGSLVTSVRSPAQALAVVLDPTANPTKVGMSSSSAILGLFASGDGSVDAAMKSGGITKVHHVDHEVNMYLLGIYAQNKTIVYGE